jgi:hypothetical protein
LENWEHYFETRHEGLGTTYERFILHDHFLKIKERHGVGTVLEAPLFGMTGISGINSVWWAIHGAEVTLVDHNRERLACIKQVWQELLLNIRLVYVPRPCPSLPFQDGEFDMSWNFAALRPDLKSVSLLRELSRITRKVIFICVPNRLNLFRLVCTLLKRSNGFSKRSGINPKIMIDTLTREGWQLEEAGYLDVPPWPDTAMSKEDLLRKIGLKQCAKRLEEGISDKGRISILDYFGGMDKEMASRMRKYTFLEKSPQWLKTVWAHHSYRIFTPMDRIQ